MTYDTDAALREIIRRSETIRDKKSAGTSALLTAVSGALALALCFVFSAFVRVSAEGIVFPQYGALMMDELAGGYVLSALAGFSLASCLTAAVCRRRQKRNDGRD